MTEEQVLSLDELIALGNEGAPQEWLDNLTGQGIGGGFEGIHDDVLAELMAEGIKTDPNEPPLPIEATPEIQFYRCNGANYTKGRDSLPVCYLVIHYTSGAQTAEGAANANCRYFAGGERGASAHYFIDDGYTVWKSVPLGDTAWHAGNWAINQRSIGIEVCTAGDFTAKEIERLTWLVQRLMKMYNIPPERVIRHYDASGKLCPAAYIDAAKWKKLHATITGKAKTSLWQGKGVYKVVKKTLWARKQPKKGKQYYVKQLKSGNTRTLVTTTEAEGYIWGKTKAGNWMPLGTTDGKSIYMTKV